jgi:dipeptidyl-peptidase-4
VAVPLSFPSQHARTRGFTLGEPRGFAVAADGSRVAFLRSLAGDDPLNRLWVLDLGERPDAREQQAGRILGGRGGSSLPPHGSNTPPERIAADPVVLLGGLALLGGPEQLPVEERARRERARERAGGIVAYAADRDLTMAAFALGGRVFVADLGPEGAVREVPAAGPALDPRPDPHGRRVAYVSGGTLYVVELEEGGRTSDRRVAGPAEGPGALLGEVIWGLPEFIAAEEMGRSRGYWWAPDGRRIAVARVDHRAVQRFHLADPANPAVEPVTLPYPAAGTANADVRLFVVDLEGALIEVAWDRAALPYLVEVVWNEEGPLTLLVQSRRQRSTRVLVADPETGATRAVATADDAAWLEIVPGVPAWLAGGRLVGTVDDAACDTRRLTIDGQPFTPPGLQVLEVLGAGGDEVLLRATEEPSEIHVWRLHAAGVPTLSRLSADRGVYQATTGGGVVVVAGASLERDGSAVTVRRDHRQVASIASLAETPSLRPRVTLLRTGVRRLCSALLLPSETSVRGPLPVLLDPYGGPHARRVLAARNGYLISQWFADQGFAVLITDGRGTPGRGPAWERAVYRDLAGPPLEDQVEALHAVAACHPELDLGKVAIRGWSFGGYLAALAVLRRPDVFHAAVAGAPVTDWRLYDTHYTERYLGDPGADPEPYRRSSLLADAARLERPLLLIHGLADDNVVAAHTLRLSSLLLTAGRPHNVLLLPGVTHMTSQEVVAENLLLLQLAFLRAALGLPAQPDP